MKFDPTKPVEFVDSSGAIWPARILATDLAGQIGPIVFALKCRDGEEVLRRADKSGAWLHGGHLRNRMVKREGWVIVDGPGRERPGVWARIYETEAGAVKNLHGNRRVARIEWEEPADA